MTEPCTRPPGADASAVGTALAIATGRSLRVRRHSVTRPIAVSASATCTVLIAVMVFLGGVQLMSVGLLGQYVSRIFEEGKRRPLYLVRADTKAGGAGR